MQMRELKLLSLEDLLDILIDQTAHHMQLIISGGNAEEMKWSRQFLADLQKEILIRQNGWQGKHTLAFDGEPQKQIRKNN